MLSSGSRDLVEKENVTGSSLKDKVLDYFSKYSMIIILILILVIFSVLTDGVILRPLNITNLILQNSHVLILAIGMLLVVLLGHVDLSVGSIVAFVGATAAIMMIQMNINPIIAFIVSLLMGALIGAWNGYWISYRGIPAFIVTLAGQLIFRGLTLVVLNGQSIAPFPKQFQLLSSGFIPDLFNGTNLHIFSLVIGAVLAVLTIIGMWRSREKKVANSFEVESIQVFIFKAITAFTIIVGFTYILSSYEGYPNILIVLGILALVYGFVTNQTVVGRQIYATGGNLKASELSGVKTKKITFWVFVNMGVLAALAGLVIAARLNAATPQAGNGFELDALASVYIGGASTSGGIGTIIGTIVGGLVMGILNNGMSIMGIGIDWQQAIKGFILLFAVILDLYNKKRKVS